MPTTETREKIIVLAELIQSQMQLDEDVVSIYNQTRRLKSKTGLYIDVAFVSSRDFGNKSEPADDLQSPDLIEIQSVNSMEIYQIDIFSANEEARIRKREVVFALTGIAAQQAQELHSFKLASIPSSFVDLSSVEGAARLNRYAITISLLTAHRFERKAAAFTIFQNPPKKILVNP